MENDPHSHVACEVTAIPNGIHIFGEITSAARVDYAAIARQVVRDIGYVKHGYGFDADTCQITVDIHEQSPDINMGVEKTDSMENGAGDQGILDKNTKFFINPTGRFCIGGPAGDSGLTGRKLIVDTYGGYARHGGGAFSGKDPSKVDRSGAYMARYLAKNVVAAGLADRCEIQISYAIGVVQPVSLLVDIFGTGKLPADRLSVLWRGQSPVGFK